MASGATAHLAFCPVAGVLVERAVAHAHGHSLFLHVPMWSGVDSPGRLWHYAGGRLAADLGGEQVGDGTALFELGGFYRETVAFLDALAAGRLPSPEPARGAPVRGDRGAGPTARRGVPGLARGRTERRDA